MAGIWPGEIQYHADSDIEIERPLLHRFVSRVLVLPELSGLTS